MQHALGVQVCDDKRQAAKSFAQTLIYSLNQANQTMGFTMPAKVPEWPSVGPTMEASCPYVSYDQIQYAITQDKKMSQNFMPSVNPMESSLQDKNALGNTKDLSVNTLRLAVETQ